MARSAKSNRRLMLILCLLALLVLLAVYAAVSRSNQQQALEQSTLLKSADFSLDRTQITELSWQYQGQSLTLLKDGDFWYVEQDRDFPLDPYYPQRMLIKLEAVMAASGFERAGGWSDYGLAPPLLDIEVALADGSRHQLRVGDRNALTDEYYLNIDASEIIYRTDNALAEAFSLTLYDMAAIDALPKYERINSLRLSGANELDIIQSAEDEQLAYTPEYKWFLRDASGQLWALNRVFAKKLAASVLEVELLACVDYRADQDELAAFGLAEPRLIAEVDYVDKQGAEQQFAVSIGHSEQGRDYLRIDGSDMVYAVDAAFTASLLDAGFDDLCAMDVLLMDWDTVRSMTVIADGQQHTLDFEHQQQGRAYQWDGAPLDAEAAEGLLTQLDELESEGRGQNGAAATADFSIIFRLDNADFPELTLALSPYDSNFHVLDFAGRSDILVNKMDVAALKQTVAALK